MKGQRTKWILAGVGALVFLLVMIVGRRAGSPMATVSETPNETPAAPSRVTPTYVNGKATVADRVAEFGAAARARTTTAFTDAGVSYPPRRVVLLAMKAERVMEVYADSGSGLKFIRSYAIHGASGVAGPKLREGDRQVPEGIYAIESLNPNSRFHVSLRVGYPNAFDRLNAEREGRSNLGGDIMIHGGSASVGCLAMGDETAEDLFTLAADTGVESMQIIIVPLDLRKHALPAGVDRGWRSELYPAISREMWALPAANPK